MKKIIKKQLSVLLSIYMLISFIPVIANAEISKAESIKLGDYVQMGTYYGAPIIWRCVAFEKIKGYDEEGNPITDAADTKTEYEDGYLPLLISDKILLLRAVDARLALYPSENIGSHSRCYERSKYSASNYWGDSTMRSWLNSDAPMGEVEWLCGNPPSSKQNRVEGITYDKEAGFLNHFMQNEQNAIKKVSQKSIVAYPEYENSVYAEGSEAHIYNTDIAEAAQNYDTAYAEYVSDKIFLPDVKQINNIYNNRDVLGEDYYMAYPSEKCADFDGFNIRPFGTDIKEWYLLRTPKTDSFDEMRFVGSDGGIYYRGAEWNFGMRPALFLNPEAEFYYGDGTEESPYGLKTFENGSGTEEDPYLIPDYATFEVFRNYINSGNGRREYFKLTEDIDLAVGRYGEKLGTNYNWIVWQPIENFRSVFDGDNHTISGINVHIQAIDDSMTLNGLFGTLQKGGVIKNLTVAGDIYNTQSDIFAGGICAQNYGKIENCVNKCTVQGISCLGGICGVNESSGVIENCINNGQCRGNIGTTGGICGVNNGTIKKCGNISPIVYYGYNGGLCGGICGQNAGTIENSYNNGKITEQQSSYKGNHGGICGHNEETGIITSCYDTGSYCICEKNNGGIVKNSYYLSSRHSTYEGINKTASQFASGEVAYLLNDGQSERVWYQTVGSDELPVFDSSHSVVYIKSYNKNEQAQRPYEIIGLQLTDSSGNSIEKPERNKSFIVEADIVKSNERDGKDYLFVAVYGSDGALQSIDYVKADFEVGSSCSFGFNIPAQEKDVGSIKAFVWNTFNSMEPLAEDKSLLFTE